MKNQIKVFVGYQFKSNYYTRSEIDKLIIDSIEKAEIDINNRISNKIQIKPILQDLLSGMTIGNQIFAKIHDADFCIFELSDLNSNVMLELGYALGLEKVCVLLQHKDEKISNIPSDLSGLYIIKYDYETLNAKIAYEIFNNSNNILNNKEKKLSSKGRESEEVKTLRSFWNIHDIDKIYIICPEIPIDDRKTYAEITSKDYLRLAKFADIDSLYNMKDFISRKFPNVRMMEYTSVEMPEEAYNENIILIGGTAWNKVTEKLMEKIRSPFYYIDGGKGNDDPIVERESGLKRLPVLDRMGSLNYDWGLFIRVPNPFNKEKNLIIINGIRTYGVLGATKCFTNEMNSSDNCSIIFKLLGIPAYFAALIKTAVINNYVAPPNLISDLESLYSFNSADMNFKEVNLSDAFN